jgi:hypothetical protein
MPAQVQQKPEVSRDRTPVLTSDAPSGGAAEVFSGQRDIEHLMRQFRDKLDKLVA